MPASPKDFFLERDLSLDPWIVAALASPTVAVAAALMWKHHRERELMYREVAQAGQAKRTGVHGVRSGWNRFVLANRRAVIPVQAAKHNRRDGGKAFQFSSTVPCLRPTPIWTPQPYPHSFTQPLLHTAIRALSHRLSPLWRLAYEGGVPWIEPKPEL